MLALNSDLVRADLPSAPNRGVDQCLFAAAVGCTLGDSDQLLGLHRQQWQCNRTDPVDLQQRRHKLDRPGSEKIAGPADRTQRLRKVVGNRWHDLVPLSRILLTQA